MSRIADEQQTRVMPARKPICLDREQRDLLPLLQSVYTIRHRGHEVCHRFAQRLQTPGMQLLISTLGNNIGDLPVLEAVEERNKMTVSDVFNCVLWIVRSACKSKPEHVHRRRCLDWLKTRELPDAREAPVGSYCQYGSYFVPGIMATLV